VTSTVDLARAEFLRTFRWTDGHADFAPVFHEASALAALGPGLVEPFRSFNPTVIIGIEARGFILGSLCASGLGVGLLLARKPGSVHPGNNIEVTTQPDWRGNQTTFRLARLLKPADRVLIVDDWVETGSQATAMSTAIKSMGATLIGTSVIVDQASESVRSALQLTGLVKHHELPPNKLAI
jgi:adenine phosphoribosyltransferase